MTSSIPSLILPSKRFVESVVRELGSRYDADDILDVSFTELGLSLLDQLELFERLAAACELDCLPPIDETTSTVRAVVDALIASELERADA